MTICKIRAPQSRPVSAVACSSRATLGATRLASEAGSKWVVIPELCQEARGNTRCGVKPLAAVSVRRFALHSPLTGRSDIRVLMGLAAENQVRTRLSAGGNRIRTIGPAKGARRRRGVSVPVRAEFSVGGESSRGDMSPSRNLKSHAVPMVRIGLPPAASLLRTCRDRQVRSRLL
jgi:hypothetical protein